MNTKKKILFLVTQSEFGGAQRFIYRLITNLDLTKYDISVAAGPEGNNPDGLLFTLKNRGFKTVVLKFLRRGVNPLFDFLGLIEIYKLIRKQNPDILFLCSSKPGILGSIAGRLAKIKKIVYRIGGWSFNDPWPNWKKKLFILLEKISAKWKDTIINNAESDRQQAIKLGIKPKDKIITIYNGIDVEGLKFLTKEDAINGLISKSKIQISNQIQNPNFKLIGTIANLYPTKGIEYLIEASCQLQATSYKLIFVVIGEGSERKKLENLIKKYNLENNFFLIGAIPEASKYLKAFDTFVLSSAKEGFPWTILEAMAAEVPIVATKVGAIPEIIDPSTGSGQAGILVEPGNPEELAGAIEKLLNDENLRKNLSQKAKKTAKQKFNLDKMIKKYEDVLLIH